MASLQIQLFGDFHLVYRDVPVTAVNQPRLQSLLAYLVLHQDAPQSRRHLAFLFWPDSTEAQAYANFRQVLHRLQRGLPADDYFLRIDAKTVQWRSDAPFTLDVAEFERLLACAEEAARVGDDALARAALQSAVACYQGDLLRSCYDDWVLSERERWREAFAKALERLILLVETQRDYALAINYAQRLLRYDPLHEITYRHLMRLHALNGDRAGALRIYHTCATILQRELGVEPSLQTRGIYEQLLSHKASSELLSNHDTQHGTQRLPAVAPHAMQYQEKLIGRQTEWQHLLTTWRAAASGGAHFLVVAGEAGIGKTRLVEELFICVSRQGVSTARTRAYAAEGALAYAPIAEWLWTDTLRVCWQRLDTVWLTELARILPELLVEQPRLPRPEPLNESWQRKRLFEALARAVLADNRPMLLVFDDLQWCDRETLEWLHYLLRYGPQAPLLIVGTVRPEEVNSDHPLTTLLLELRSTEQVTEIELGPLNLDESAALAAQVVGYSLALDDAQQLFGETEGNPLFVVETARVGLRKGIEEIRSGGESIASASLPPHARLPLPPKIHAIIQRRLGQLSPTTRELVRLASVIGRSFTYQMLAQASDLAEDALVRGLDELWQRRLVRELGGDAYDFSHDRIREAAQAAISQAQRRLLHRRVAQALESVHAANLDPVSGQLAGHYERAGLLEQAILYYRRAGEAARRLFSNQEAINHWTKALELLKALPATLERMQQQLDLLCVLGPALIAAKGFTAPEVAQVYRQAQGLCHQVGDTTRLFMVLEGLASVFQAGADIRASRGLAEQCLTLAQTTQDTALLMAADTILGEDLLYLGELSLAKTHLEKALTYYDRQQQTSTAHLFGGSEPVVATLGSLCVCLWLLGHIDSAFQRSQEVFAHGQQLSDPLSRGYASCASGIHHALRQDWPLAFTRIEETLALAAEWEIAAMLVWPLKGWMLAEQDRVAEGIALMELGLLDVSCWSPVNLAALAETYGRVGRVDEGLALIDKIFAIAQQYANVFWNAELYRLQGELLIMQGTDEQAVEMCYWQAIQLSRQQKAKSFELRAVMSLARLWQRQGKRTEARQMLAAIYGWFTDGFDTLDLQDAKVLLEELS